jgi:wyosine [tRNA(Phe)-imidazoG37] synthetase (radical SAM superfamily)
MEKMAKNFKYIYGPVYSWRLGISLGIDPISPDKKICSFDCIYCQLGKTKVFSKARKEFVPAKKIIEEIKSLPRLKIDCITFSGNGEPTLAKNLGKMIREIRKIRKEKIAVITNASLIDRKDVQKDLLLADTVLVKLDACSEDMFKKENRPIAGIELQKILKGIAGFKSLYKGKLCLQVMFTRTNARCAEGIAEIARELKPDEVQLNTPLRFSKEKPVSKKIMDRIKLYFKGMNVKSVYDAPRKAIKPIDNTGTLKRHGINLRNLVGCRGSKL